MKEIFDNKKKLLLFATLLFFFTGVVINLLPTNVKSITSGLIFALYFLVLSFIYGKEKESNLELPTILMIIYMITGYITIFNIMSGKKIIFAFVLGATGSLLAYLQKRSKSITKKIAKENTSIKEKVKNNFNDKIDIPTSKKITTYVLSYNNIYHNFGNFIQNMHIWNRKSPNRNQKRLYHNSINVHHIHFSIIVIKTHP